MNNTKNNIIEAKEAIKALIFASGNGILVDKIYISMTSFFKKEVINLAIDELEKEYSKNNGVLLIRYENKIQFQTNPIYGEKISDVLIETKELEISKTLLQVLSIVAYKQPITKAEVEELRGVNPDYAMSMLLRLNLIKSVGRKDTIGRPILYATTEEFLKKFGLKSLLDLPNYDYIMNEIKTKYESVYGETKLFKEKKIDSTYTKDSDPSDDDSLPDFLEGEDFIEID